MEREMDIEMKTIYQDEQLKVEIPLPIYHILTCQRKLTLTEIERIYKQVRLCLTERGFPINKIPAKIGDQILYLKQMRLLQFTPEFIEMKDIFESIVWTNQLLQEKFDEDTRSLLDKWEHFHQKYLEKDFVYIIFFDKPVCGVDGFIAIGDKTLLKVLFIAYDNS